MSSCCQWHSLAAVSVAYNEGKLLEKMGGGGGGRVGGVKRMPGDLCVIEVFEMSHFLKFHAEYFAAEMCSHHWRWWGVHQE